MLNWALLVVGFLLLVKGADWAEDAIVGADLVRAAGGRVLRIELLTGVSTSAIIQRVVARYGAAAADGRGR